MKRKKTYFKGNVQMTKFEQDLNTEIWYLEFEDKIFLQTSTFWRLSKDGKIKFISADNGLNYSIHNPAINLENDIKDFIGNQKLIKISINQINNDVSFIFENKITITFFVSSMAIENGSLIINKKSYYFIQGGEIA